MSNGGKNLGSTEPVGKAEALQRDGVLDSYFAPASRATSNNLQQAIQFVTQSPVTTALLRSATAMMCVLNEQRQIVTLNAACLDALNVVHADDVLGLRPGEAMNCTHSQDWPGGCGTSQHCSNCGAAIAIVASQRSGKVVQRECQLSIRDRKGALHDLAFLVRASPFEISQHRFTVFSLSDISIQKLQSGLERAFLHDLSNLVAALSASSELLLNAETEELGAISEDIYEFTQRLSHEVIMQRLLLSDAPAQYRPNWRTVRIADIIAFLQRVFSSHPAASAKRLLVRASLSEEECHTDPSLLERILSNMLLNAFEATEAGHEVRLGVESSASEVHFTVWNSEYLAEEVASRIFQRYFSTKRGLGRGQGTYAIRLLGEKLLGGQVGFSSSLQTGTTFYLKLPTSGTPPSR